MNKVFAGTMLMLLLTGMWTLAFKIQPVKAATITVPDDYSTIQAAVSAANPGDTIFVRNGTYHEHVNIQKPLTLAGENKNTTIIDGDGYGPVIEIYAERVNVIGFTVQNAGWGEPPPLGIAVYLYYASLCNISDNIVLSSRHGIALLFYSRDNIVSKNTILDADLGIANFNPWVSDNNTILGNWISNCSTGIYFNYPYNIRVIGNIISDSTTFPCGIHFQSGGYNNTVVGNRVENSENAIRLDYADSNFVGENVVTNNIYGLFVGYESSDNVIYNNVASNSTIGIMIWDNSNNNTVINNEASNNYYGLGISSSNQNKIYHNNILNNTYQVLNIGDSANDWDNDYPTGGNYWSDYTGADLNLDGIGDTPYIIDSNNLDRYPLMNPWSSLPVHNINTGLGYATIQDAISAPETLDGHAIFVEAGTYYENVVVNKTVSLIGENQNSTIIDGMGNGNVVTITASNVFISEFRVKDSDPSKSGIYFESCGNITIHKNTIENTSLGIFGWISMGNNTVTGNMITNNSIGIWFVSLGSKDTIVGNVITNSLQTGINLHYAYYCNITRNIITNNGESGIYFDGSYNRIWENEITKNGIGVGLQDAFYNNIYHNNFFDNTIQISRKWDTSTSSNVWDDGYPSGGNYWSDYNGTDLYHGAYQNETGSDGIGDIPYIIDGSNRDSYPLTKQYPWATHDVGITSVAPSRNVVGKGYNASIDVMMFNYGNNTETVDVTVYANLDLIGELYGIELTGRNFTIIPFTWNTTGFAYGTYTLNVVAWPVLGEIDQADNLKSGTIILSVVGDITGGTSNLLDFVPDGKVDMKDIGVVARFFGQNVQPAPPNCDLTGPTEGVPDGKVDMRDIGLAARHFGESAR